jgi:NAD(P)-dependent dehydrogenase (short-subunit alcohol dehydrogenase family)
MRDVRGKTAVVTGGGSGIGQGMCAVFARNGMSVVVADIEGDAADAVASEIVDAGGRATAVTVDVADRSSVDALAAAATDAFGAVHLLCNNAGVSHRRRGIHATHEDWVWMLGVNLWGVIHGIEAFLPAMLESGEEAHIVNTASMNGIVPSAFSAMYSTSKYGVMGLTETMRNELDGTNVGISVLCPAGVVTRIGQSERNRPATLTAPTPPPAHVPSTRFDISPPLPPDVVGEMTLQGVRDDALYIFTDMKVRDLIDDHHDRMVAAFDDLTRFEASRQTRETAP